MQAAISLCCTFKDGTLVGLTIGFDDPAGVGQPARPAPSPPPPRSNRHRPGPQRTHAIFYADTEALSP
jgi:hypothetical protein